MPDQVHNSERDFCFFLLNDFFCVSCYEQIPTSKVKERPSDATRATIQKSLCYFTKKFDYTPLGLAYLRARMQEYFHTYFVQAQTGSFANKQVLQNLWKDIPEIIRTATSPTSDLPDNRYLKFSPVLRLFSRFGRTVLPLLKLLLLEKKVVVYGVPIGETSDIVMALISLIPLFTEKMSNIKFLAEGELYSAPNIDAPGTLQSKRSSLVAETLQYSAAEQQYSKLHLPLRVASYSFISGQVVLNQVDWLNSLPSFFVATSNGLMPMRGQMLDLDACFDATTAQLTCYTESLKPALKLTPEDTAFMDYILYKVRDEGTQDPFAEFVVVDDPTVSHSDEGTTNFTSGTTAAWQSKETWVRTMFAGYLKSLLATIAAQAQGEHAAGKFNGHFLAEWAQTRNYKTWRAQIDVRALHADPTLNNLTHPGSTLPHTGHATLMEKSYQTVKGSISSLSSSTHHIVNVINSAFKGNGSDAAAPTHPGSPANHSSIGWGLEGHQAHSTAHDQVTSPQPSKAATSSSHLATATSSSSTPGKSPSFFESMKQKLVSPFGRAERAEKTAAHFEPLSLDGAPPTITQPAQPEHVPPHNPANKGDDSEEDLLGF